MTMTSLFSFYLDVGVVLSRGILHLHLTPATLQHNATKTAVFELLTPGGSFSSTLPLLSPPKTKDPS